MPPRIPWRVTGSWSSRVGTVASRRTLFDLLKPTHKPLRFTVVNNRAPSLAALIPHLWEQSDYGKQLANPGAHNAAVLLTTSERWMIQGLNQPGVLAELVKHLVAGADVSEFSLLCASVDHVCSPLGMYNHAPAIAILRSNEADIQPQNGGDPEPQSKQENEKVGALAFEMGKTCVTVPLARTTFHDGKPSKLVQHRFSITDGSPRLVSSTELKSKRIRLPSISTTPESIADLRTSIPLYPITRPRRITESFGNIVRGVEYGNETVPASQELEAAINGMPRPKTPGPVGVWAAVTPEDCPSDQRMEEVLPPASFPNGDEAMMKTVQHTNSYLQKCYANGGRVHRILSGGGGWGPKKGLLSLDPEQTHFALSDEEDLLRFSRMMDGGTGLAPPGSRIQYFLSTPDIRKFSKNYKGGYFFGVPGNYASGGVSLQDKRFGAGHMFGALSNDGIFISGPPTSNSTDHTETRLSVPHSRVMLLDTQEDIGGMSLLGDAATLATVDALLF